MEPKKTALILVGFQNDYFAKDGILRGVVEDPDRVDEVLMNTLAFIDAIKDTGVSIISTPIALTPEYRAMASPVGILNAMKELKAFSAGTKGAETIAELLAYGDRITYVHGKVGFNAFAHTALDGVLTERGITHALVCGMVTSLCIDSTGRAAYERGLNVTILSDNTSARTEAEHAFYCANIFPLYGRAATNSQVLSELLSAPV